MQKMEELGGGGNVKSILLYICDPDERYLDRLDGFMQHMDYSPFVIRTFTSPMRIYKEEEYPGILLVNSIFVDAIKEQIEDTYGSKEWSQIIFLNQAGEAEANRLAEMFREEEWVHVIEKYQSAKQIYEYILGICAQMGECLIGPGALQERQTKLYGIYSPENKKLQREFAFQIARTLTNDAAEAKQGLLLDLLEFSRKEGRETQAGGLSDLILLIRGNLKEKKSFLDQKDQTIVHLESAGDSAVCTEEERDLVRFPDSWVRKEENLDILLPAANPYDLKEIGEEEWYYWLEKMLQKGSYGSIVLSFESSVPALCLLKLCTKVYMPFAQEEERECQYFQETLRFMGNEEIADRMELVRV